MRDKTILREVAMQKLNAFNVLKGIATAAMAAAGAFAAPPPPGARRVVLITGSSSGLGLALAERYGKAGCRLVLNARDLEDLKAARTRLLKRKAVRSEEDILLVPADVSNEHEAAALVDKAIAHFGSIDVLINNAGIIQVGPVETQTIANFRKAMDTNFFGAVNTTQGALPSMLARKAGRIVNIASIGGKFAMPHMLPYVASKFALVGYSQGLHAELRHKGVRVTTVCPGLMRTGGQAHAEFSGNVAAESRWFNIAATTPILAASVKRAARRIYDAEYVGRAEITITPQAWLAARFVGFAPETAQFLASFVSQYLLPSAPDGARIPSAPPGSVHAEGFPS